MRTRPILAGGLVAAATAAVAVGLTAHADPLPLAPTSTPIKHVVVLFDENESFDHYFGTYPNATNPAGPAAVHRQGRHAVGQRARPDPADQQPELVPAAAAGPLRGGHLLAEPRLRRRAAGVRRRPDGQVPGVHGGRLVRCRAASRSSWTTTTATRSPGLWNLAQNFAMSDNSFGTNFGPSTVGAINLVSGQTHGTDVPSGSAASRTTRSSATRSPSSTTAPTRTASSSRARTSATC